MILSEDKELRLLGISLFKQSNFYKKHKHHSISSKYSKLASKYPNLETVVIEWEIFNYVRVENTEFDLYKSIVSDDIYAIQFNYGANLKNAII